MLDTYLTDTKRLLQNPAPATGGLYTDPLITASINKARRHLAIKGECIRKIGTISTISGTRVYSFSGVNIGVAATTGIAGILNIRRINFATGDGEKFVTPRAWEWFDLYYLNNPVPLGDPDNPGNRWPRNWAQYGQGGSASADLSDTSGSFYVDPVPDDAYELRCDCLCYPVPLEDDTTVEALPVLFTDAVPFIAAWYVLLGAQNQARRADAEGYYKYGIEYVGIGRMGSNPSVIRPIYEQADDPAQAGKAGQGR